jgi:hypothetical protein
LRDKYCRAFHSQAFKDRQYLKGEHTECSPFEVVRALSFDELEAER